MRIFPWLAIALFSANAYAEIEFRPRNSFLYNEAIFNHYRNAHLSALTALNVGRERGLIGEFDEQAELLYAESLLSYGLYEDALALYRKLLDKGGLSRTERAEIWLRLSRYEYERGYFSEVETTLAEMAADVGGRRSGQRLELLALAQMRQRDYEAAIETTLTGSMRSKSQYAQYNLAMAYLATDNVREARRVLDRLGRDLVNDPVEHALHDRANLALAYNYLAEANGIAAKPVLQRIRLEGPFSERALLGMGWAELAIDKAEEIRKTVATTPDTIGGVLGVILRPGRVSDNLYNRLGLPAAKATREDKQDRLRRALVPWTELHARDPKNPAVLEVQLAIPYVLAELGDMKQASVFYEQAISRLESGRDEIDKAIDGIRSGRMIETMIRRDRELEAGWTWRLRDLPNAPETFYLAWILAENRFQEALKNYRDVRQIQRSSASWLARLESYKRGVGLASVRPEILIMQARQGKPPVWEKLVVELSLAQDMGRFPRNETIEGLLAWSYRFAAPVSLKLATTTPNFQQGAPRAVGDVRARLRTLLERSNELLREQRALLERIAVGELEGYKAKITRYLIDARFALARIYDQVQIDAASDEEIAQ